MKTTTCIQYIITVIVGHCLLAYLDDNHWSIELNY